MSYTIGTARSVEIEWQYGITTLAHMIGLTLPRYMRLQVIDGHADWWPRFLTGRVLQLALRQFDDLGKNPSYIYPSISILNGPWAKEHCTIREETIGHPTVLNRRGQVVQNEVFLDRQVRVGIINADLPVRRWELMQDLAKHHVSEKSELVIEPWSFELDADTDGNTAATRFALAMHYNGYRPATLTETVWYAAKYLDKIPEGRILVPWAGYSGGFSEGRQIRNHRGLPFVVRHKGNLKLEVAEFLGQSMRVTREVEYLAVKY